MKLTVLPYFLEFIHPFALAHGTREGTQLAYVKIEKEGTIAYGEASLPPYLPESYETVEQWIATQVDQVKECMDSNPFENQQQLPFSPTNPAASSALQAAIINWYLKAKETKLSDYFPQSAHQPALSLTITKQDFPYLEEKLSLVTHFTHFKLKLTGTEDDLEFVQAIRKRTTLPFCIDINQGITDKEKAIKLMTSLEKEHCAIIEQPLSAEDHEGHYWLKTRLSIPIVADESIRLLTDLHQFHEAYSGVNIKLMKCGGLFHAQEMLKFIVDNYAEGGYKKLLGCMTESTLGVSMPVVLLSQVDIADLDSPYLVKNDPFENFEITEGRVRVSDNLRLKEDLWAG